MQFLGLLTTRLAPQQTQYHLINAENQIATKQNGEQLRKNIAM